jgi:hypothetical protein
VLLLSESLETNGMTIFRDHASASTFHYLPNMPHLVTDDGRAGIQLLLFRSEKQSGGVLLIEVDLTPDATTLETVRGDLSQRFGAQATLLPVLFDQASVRASVLDAAPPAPTPDAQSPSRFVERILGTTVPSLDRLRASFAIDLTPEAAVLMEAAMRSGALPVIIVYDLSISGLQPSRGVRARVKYHMAYDYLRARVSASTLYFKPDLDREAEALQKQGLIEIEDVDYQGVDPAVLAERQTEMHATLDELMQGMFFTPAASPAAVADAPIPQRNADAYWTNQGRPKAAFSLRVLNQDEQQNLSYDYSETRVAKRSIAPQGSLRLPAGTDISKVILPVTTTWPPPLNQIRAFTLSDAGWSGVAAIQIDLRQGTDVRTIVLSPEKCDVTTALRAGPAEFRVKTVLKNEPEAIGQPLELSDAFVPLTTSNLVFDPGALIGRRELHVAVGGIDFNVVAKVAGQIRMEGDRRTILLDALHREATFTILGMGTAAIEADLQLPSGESVSLKQDVRPDERFVILNHPPGRFHVVTVMLRDPLLRFSGVFVEIEAAEGEARRAIHLDASAQATTWSAPRSQISPGTFRYRVRKVLHNNAEITDDWQVGTGSLLLLGDTDTRMETIRVVLLGAADSLGGLLQLKSQRPPSGVDGTVELVLEPGRTTLDVQLPIASNASRLYSVVLQIFFPECPSEVTRDTETAQVLLLPVKAARVTT